MYTTLVNILIIILVAFVFLVLYLRNKEIKIIQKQAIGNNIFLSAKDAIKLIAKQAELTDSEIEGLEKLYELSGNHRLHLGLEHDEPARQWLIKMQRLLFHNTLIDDATKSNLEFLMYEIFRKVHIARISNGPVISNFKDLQIGQNFDIIIPNSVKVIVGELIQTSIFSFTISMDKNNFDLFKKYAQEKQLFTFSFWKKMDAGYEFVAPLIRYLGVNKNSVVFQYPKKVTRTRIRKYPRKICEILVNFKVGFESIDPNTGIATEKFGSTELGLISNLGGNGCSVISHKGFADNSKIKLSFSVFEHQVNIEGTIKNVLRFKTNHIISVEFPSDLNPSDRLKIYNFLFSDINAIQY